MEKNKEPNLADVHHYILLQNLLNTTGSAFLRELFRKKWKSSQGSEWKNTEEKGKEFIEGVGKKFYKLSKSIQRKNLKSGDIDVWDLPLLVNWLVFDVPETEMNPGLQELKEIRNQLAHRGNVEVKEEEFSRLWKETCQAMTALGIPQKDLDAANAQKDKLEATAGDADNPNQLEAGRLKEKGNELFKEKRFAEAVQLYTQAVLLPGIPTSDLAVLFSNRSAAFFKCGDFSSAKADAKAAVYLKPTWWKGYTWLAKAYEKSERYKDALEYYEKALGMQPSSEIKDARDLCRHAIAEQEICIHMDPEFSNTIFDNATAWSDCSPHYADLKRLQKIGVNMGMPSAICCEGSKHFLGIDVPQSDEMAAKMFEKAAMMEAADGMYNLAMLKREGKGVKTNLQEAHQLLLRAAEQEPFTEVGLGFGKKIPNLGVREAQHVLGQDFETGMGVDINFKEALEWYEKALENGMDISANNIAVIYAERREGVECSMKKAFLYWKLAAHKGVLLAMENLARNFLMEREWITAQKWYTLAVKNGSVTLPSHVEKFKFDKFPLKDFDCDNFREDLVKELLKSPLKHLVSCECKREIVLRHRRLLKKRKEMEQKNLAKLHPKPLLDLVGLKPICLKEMDQTKDHVYEGFVIKLTLTEDAVLGMPSIAVVGQDDNGDMKRIAVYNFPQDDGTQDSLGFGCRISIVSPYFRMATDGHPTIRVDDASLLFLHPDLTDKRRCRNCGKGEGTVVCRKCRRAFYCSEECLRVDAEEMQHGLVCMKRL